MTSARALGLRCWAIMVGDIFCLFSSHGIHSDQYLFVSAFVILGFCLTFGVWGIPVFVIWQMVALFVL